jgi:hypothetical protein
MSCLLRPLPWQLLLLSVVASALVAAVSPPSFPPVVNDAHVQGMDIGLAGSAWPRLSPDGRFMCVAAGAATRGMSLYCWHLANSSSSIAASDPLFLRTGLQSDGAMVRAALLVPGGTSTFADWCFRMDGRAVAVALSAPSRLWMWQRDVATGTLNGPPRLIYTLHWKQLLCACLYESQLAEQR